MHEMWRLGRLEHLRDGNCGRVGYLCFQQLELSNWNPLVSLGKFLLVHRADVARSENKGVKAASLLP